MTMTMTATKTRLRAQGRQGSWFATVAQRQLPCVHDVWLTACHYHDPNAVADDARWLELHRAIQSTGEVILTRSRRNTAGTAFQRQVYCHRHG